mgnify:CR=1 FL=1
MILKPKKHLGQNFLINEEIAENIVDSLVLKKSKNIIEIGPGKGALTKFIIQKSNRIKLIEIDLSCVRVLKNKFQKLTVIHDDFLKIDLNTLGFKKYALIGNFPYNVSSQILFHALNYRNNITEIVGMFQKEVAERICSKPNSKKYGVLSVILQAYFDCEQLFDVSSKNFYPQPKINSTVIRLTRNKISELDCRHEDFIRTVKEGFSQRRKKLKNALKKMTKLDEKSLENTLQKRAENLSVSEFVMLTNYIFQQK